MVWVVEFDSTDPYESSDVETFYFDKESDALHMACNKILGKIPNYIQGYLNPLAIRNQYQGATQIKVLRLFSEANAMIASGKYREAIIAYNKTYCRPYEIRVTERFISPTPPFPVAVEFPEITKEMEEMDGEYCDKQKGLL